MSANTGTRETCYCVPGNIHLLEACSLLSLVALCWETLPQRHLSLICVQLRHVTLLQLTGLPRPPTRISDLHFQTHLHRQWCLTKGDGVKGKQWMKSTMLNVQVICNISTHLEDSATETKLIASSPWKSEFSRCCSSRITQKLVERECSPPQNVLSLCC